MAGRPRAPRCLDNETSTLDWFGEKFMIIYTGPLATDADALMAAFKDHAIPVGSCQIKDPHIQTLYERPLVLVRPDGHVAWRGQAFPDDADSLIRQIQRASALAQNRATFSCSGTVSHLTYVIVIYSMKTLIMSTDRFDVTGKVVLITGAGQGIGRDYALAFANAGAKPVLAG